MAEPILTLETLVDRPQVKINGTSYGLKSPEEVSLLDYHRIWAQGRELDAAFSRPDLSMDEIGVLAKKIDELCRFLLDAPDDVHTRLTEVHKMRIVRTFIVLQLGPVVPAEPEPKPEGPPSTTESGSPA